MLYSNSIYLLTLDMPFEKTIEVERILRITTVLEECTIHQIEKLIEKAYCNLKE